MTKRFPHLILGLSLAIGGCHAAVMPPVGDTILAGKQLQGQGLVQVRFRPAFATQDYAATWRNVHHYRLTLYQNGQPVTASGLTNPLIVPGPADSATFANVPAGSDFTVGVMAEDANNTSLSGNEVISTTSTHVPGGPALSISLTLRPADMENLVSLADTYYPDDWASTSWGAAWSSVSGRALVNNLTGRIMPGPLNNDLGSISVQPAGSKGYQMWIFRANTAGKQATPARPIAKPMPTETSAPIPPPRLATPNTAPIVTDTNIVIAKDKSAYFVQIGALVRLPHSDGALVPIDTGVGSVSSLAIDSNDDLVLATPTAIQKRTASSGHTQATTIAAATNPSLVATDGFDAVYWLEGTTIKKAARTATGYLAPTTIASGLNDVRGLTADAYGNVYYAVARQVYSVLLDDQETAYATAQNTTYLRVGTPADIDGLAADRAGNLYVATGDLIWLHPHLNTGIDPVDGFRVVGGGTPGTGVDDLNSDSQAPFSLDGVKQPMHLFVTADGLLSFTSEGPSGRFLRRFTQ